MMSTINEIMQEIQDYELGMKTAELSSSMITKISVNFQVIHLTITENNVEKPFKLSFGAQSQFLRQIKAPENFVLLLASEDVDTATKALVTAIKDLSAHKRLRYVYKDDTIYGVFPKVYPFYGAMEVISAFKKVLPEDFNPQKIVFDDGDIYLYMKNSLSNLMIMKFSIFHRFAPQISVGHLIEEKSMIYDFANLGLKGSMSKITFTGLLDKMMPLITSINEDVSAYLQYMGKFAEVTIPSMLGDPNIKKIRYFGRRMGYPSEALSNLVEQIGIDPESYMDINLETLISLLDSDSLASNYGPKVFAGVGNFIAQSYSCSYLGQNFIGKDDLSLDKLNKLATRLS